VCQPCSCCTYYNQLLPGAGEHVPAVSGAAAYAVGPDAASVQDARQWWQLTRVRRSGFCRVVQGRSLVGEGLVLGLLPYMPVVRCTGALTRTELNRACRFRVATNLRRNRSNPGAALARIDLIVARRVESVARFAGGWLAASHGVRWPWAIANGCTSPERSLVRRRRRRVTSTEV
jgi:hypothetical protein